MVTENNTLTSRFGPNLATSNGLLVLLLLEMLFLSPPLSFCELDLLYPLADSAVSKPIAPFLLPVFDASSTERGKG